MPPDPKDEPTFGDFLAQIKSEQLERLTKLNSGDTLDYIDFDVEAAKAASACQRRDNAQF